MDHPVYVKIAICKFDFSAVRRVVRGKRMLVKAMISYEKGIDVVASGALTIRRLLRDNVERRIASVLTPRGRRSAIVIAIVIS